MESTEKLIIANSDGVAAMLCSFSGKSLYLFIL